MTFPVGITLMNSILLLAKQNDDTKAILEDLISNPGLKIVQDKDCCSGKPGDIAVLFMYPNGARASQKTSLSIPTADAIVVALTEIAELETIIVSKTDKLNTVSLSQLNLQNIEELNYCRRDSGAEVLSDEEIKESCSSLPTGFVVKDKTNTIIGCAVLGFDSDQNSKFLVPVAGGNDCPWLFELFVEEEWRGVGIGKMLVQACIDYLDKQGYFHICLDTHTAQQYYIKNWGFVYSHNTLYENRGCDVFWLKINKKEIHGKPI